MNRPAEAQEKLLLEVSRALEHTLRMQARGRWADSIKALREAASPSGDAAKLDMASGPAQPTEAERKAFQAGRLDAVAILRMGIIEYERAAREDGEDGTVATAGAKFAARILRGWADTIEKQAQS